MTTGRLVPGLQAPGKGSISRLKHACVRREELGTSRFISDRSPRQNSHVFFLGCMCHHVCTLTGSRRKTASTSEAKCLDEMGVSGSGWSTSHLCTSRGTCFPQSWKMKIHACLWTKKNLNNFFEKNVGGTTRALGALQPYLADATAAAELGVWSFALRQDLPSEP